MSIRRYHVATVVGASLLAVMSAGPVAAECPWVPALPTASQAIPSARTIIIGKVVENFRGAHGWTPDFGLRVDEVVRGSARIGEVRRFTHVEPNWAWTFFGGGAVAPTASCTLISAALGDVLVFALDTLEPGGRRTDNGHTWVQPPTRYHGVGVLAGVTNHRRTERIARAEIHTLAQLPPTDTEVAPVARSGPPVGPLVILLAGIVAGSLAVRRRWSPSMTEPARHQDRSPSG